MTPFDGAAALAFHDGNQRLLDRLLAEYLLHYQHAASDLAGLLEHDTAGAERLAHNLKSLAAGFGAAPLAHASAALETALTQAQQALAPTGHRALLERFATAHASFTAAVRDYLARSAATTNEPAQAQHGATPLSGQSPLSGQ